MRSSSSLIERGLYDGRVVDSHRRYELSPRDENSMRIQVKLTIEVVVSNIDIVDAAVRKAWRQCLSLLFLI